MRDLFICHASEDKDSFVRPLALALVHAGWSVWYDELSLAAGDSLRSSIDRGLAEARHGIVVLSPSFFSKNWSNYELDGLMNKEMGSGEKVIIPIWHGVNFDDVVSYSPPLSGRFALRSDLGMGLLIAKLAQAIGKPRIAAHPFPNANWMEARCPECGKMGRTVGYEVDYAGGFHDVSWFECPTCGYEDKEA